MKKKSIVCGVLASSIAVAATFGGCSLVSTNTAADMNQTIATVNISKAANFNDEFGDYASAVGETDIIKRELVAYFINYGYSYYQSNQSYEETFKALLDQLVDNAILVQYSTMYLLKEKGTNAEADDYDPNALTTYKSKETDKEKYEYLLGAKDGKDSEDVKIAKYNLYYSINSAIDAQEKKILKEETSSNGTDTRTAPSGVDTQKENYYPQKEDGSLDYKIYTGYAGYTLDESGVYEKDKLEGTTNATRIAAYSNFISNLASSSYDLVDTKKEDLREVDKLNYIQYEYVNQLQQRIINKYYDVYEEKQEYSLKDLDKDGEHYSTLDAHYNNLLASQKENYKNESNFTSSMDSMSDTSFVLYSPSTDDTKSGGKFGFVYNILLPFSDSQSDALKALQSIYADSDLDGGYKPEYYEARNVLLNSIETTDQRAAWFNGATEYAFNAKDAKVADYFGTADNTQHSDWLFFENNVSNPDKYEPLDKYAGLYPYNGTVVEKDDEYVLLPNKLKIDAMLDEFVAYIDYVMGNDKGSTTYDKTKNYGVGLADNLYKKGDDSKPVLINGKEVIDYSNFVYATGKVNFGTDTEADNRTNLLVNKTDKNEKASKQYLALSAVNELQYAYTTDTGVLSQYLGYSVQAGDTSYIKEFEYAAHLAIAGDSDKGIKGGAGSYVVCAGDYGWHLIYVTYTFDADAYQYGEHPNWEENVDKEGTFENLFYEYYKSQKLPDISTKTRNRIITDFKGDTTVTKYESAYKNLFELDKNN